MLRCIIHHNLFVLDLTHMSPTSEYGLYLVGCDLPAYQPDMSIIIKRKRLNSRGHMFLAH